MVGCKTIQQRQRHSCQIERGIEVAFRVSFFIKIGTRERGKFHVVEFQNAIDIVRTVVFRHIDELGAEVAHRRVFIDKLANVEVGRNGHNIVGLHEVEVAVHHSLDVGRVGNDGEDSFEVEMVERGGDVLLDIEVVVVGVNLDTRAVVGFQHEVGRNAVVASQKHEIIIVHTEFPIAQNGFFQLGAEHQTVVFHRRLHTHSQAEFAVGIVESGAESGASVLQNAIDEGVEGVLRIFVVVANLCLINRAHGIALNGEIQRVEQHTIDHERLQMQPPVKAFRGRRIDRSAEVADVVALVVEHFDNEIVATAIDVQLGVGQQATQTTFVNHALVVLPLNLGCEAFASVEQPLVVAFRVEVEMEIAARNGGAGLRGGREGVEIHLFGVIDGRFFAVFHPDGQIGHRSLNLVVVFQVAVDVELRPTLHHHRAVAHYEMG